MQLGREATRKSRLTRLGNFVNLSIIVFIKFDLILFL